jgi:hypothetical protein
VSRTYRGPLIPDGARWVAQVGDEVVVYDVTHILDDAFPRGRYPSRPKGQAVDRLFIHHSGVDGAAGFAGLFNSHRYTRTQRKPRPFPIQTYAHWIPAEPVLDGLGRLVVFRACDPDDRHWHTGGRANDRGEATVLQGNRREGPTPSQRVALDAIIRWRFRERAWSMVDAETHLSWHARATRDGAPNNKPSCPGRGTVAWLTEWIRRA